MKAELTWLGLVLLQYTIHNSFETDKRNLMKLCRIVVIILWELWDFVQSHKKGGDLQMYGYPLQSCYSEKTCTFT